MTSYTKYSDLIQLDSPLPSQLANKTFCIIDSEGFISNPREFCFSLCDIDVNEVKVTSFLIFNNQHLTEILQKTLQKLMSKYKNLIFVGFNTGYDLDVLQEWSNLDLKCKYIDIMPAFQKRFNSKCASLHRASIDYRTTTNKPMWERYMKHSAYQDCLETLECFLFIAHEQELEINTFSQPNQSKRLRMALKDCIDRLVNELDSSINTLPNAKMKKMYLKEMLWYIYTQYTRNEKIDSFREIVINTPSYSENTNIREYGIPFNAYLDKKNLTRICYPQEQDILISIYNMILDIEHNNVYTSMIRKSFHQLYDSPEKQKNLRDSFEAQENAFLKKMKDMQPLNLEKSKLFLNCLLNYTSK